MIVWKIVSIWIVIKWIDKMNVLSSKNYSKNEWLILSEYIWSEWKMER